MVTQEQLNHYWEKGWVVIEGVFDPAVVDGIAERSTAIIEEEIKDPDIPAVAGERLASGKIIPRKLMGAFFKHPSFQEFVLNDRFNKVIEMFIKGTPLLFAEQILMKPPRHGGPKPYHQDNFHFQCFPADHVITAWIALDDVGEENGCLRYISGSHKEGMIPHFPMENEPHNKIPSEDRIDLSREELAPVGKGGVVFHHGYTLHSSHRNHSDRWRRGYATHWITPAVSRRNGDLDGAVFSDERYRSFLSNLSHQG